MTYKAKTLFSLIEDINRSIFLPHIQRPFVWDEEQMQRLFDSLMRNYPIQTLLFWRTKDEIKARKFLTEIVWDVDLSDFYDKPVSEAGREKVFVLDGQQRLQSLYAIFSGAISKDEQNKKHRAEAYFDLTSGNSITTDGFLYSLKFANQPLTTPWYRVTDLLSKDSQKNAEELADAINDDLDQRKDCETGEELKNRQKQVRRNFSQLVSLLREEKHFWVQQLDGVANKYPYQTVLDIFVRVNSGGTKLNASDLMFAAMKEGWDEIEAAIEETAELLQSTGLDFDKTFPLKCLLVVHGKGAETTPDKFNGEKGKQLLEQMKQHWEQAEQAFQELRDFIKNDLKIYAEKVVRSHNSFIPLFDYFYHNPKPDERARSLMRGYYYKAQLFGWYSQSTDAVINGLHAIVGKAGVKNFPIAEVKQLFLGRGFSIEISSKDLDQTRLRFLILNLVYIDQFGGSPFDVKFKGNEPHIDHIYPRHACISKLGLSSYEVNHIGNYRFVGAIDNIRKRGELPSSYFGRLKNAGVDVTKHLLVPAFGDNPEDLVFDNKTYKNFRDSRRKMIWTICERTVNPELVQQNTGAKL